MFDHDRDFPRAYTVPGIPHGTASTLGVKWALAQASALGSSVSIYAPGKQNLSEVPRSHPAVHALIQSGVHVRTWRDFGPGRGVVVALWPDERYRAAMAKGLTILRRAGYALDPEALHTHAIGNGWRASNADKLREVAKRINEGRVIQGMKSAPLRDDVLEYWRERAANGSDVDEQ